PWSDHRNGENGAGGAVGHPPACFGGHRDALVSQEVRGGDRTAFACRQHNRPFAFRQHHADSERFLVSRRSEDRQHASLGIRSEAPRRLGVEERTSPVSDASGDQVGIERLSEKATKIRQSLGRAMWEWILHETSMRARWLPRWRATCGCNSYAQSFGTMLAA